MQIFDRTKVVTLLDAIFQVQKSKFESKVFQQVQTVTNEISKKRQIGTSGTDLIEFFNAARELLLIEVQETVAELKRRLVETDINKQYFWIIVDEHLTSRISELCNFVGSMLRSKREFNNSNTIRIHQMKWPLIASEVIASWKKLVLLEKHTAESGSDPKDDSPNAFIKVGPNAYNARIENVLAIDPENKRILVDTSANNTQIINSKIVGVFKSKFIKSKINWIKKHKFFSITLSVFIGVPSVVIGYHQLAELLKQKILINISYKNEPHPPNIKSELILLSSICDLEFIGEMNGRNSIPTNQLSCIKQMSEDAKIYLKYINENGITVDEFFSWNSYWYFNITNTGNKTLESIKIKIPQSGWMIIQKNGQKTQERTVEANVFQDLKSIDPTDEIKISARVETKNVYEFCRNIVIVHKEDKAKINCKNFKP
jgi:hypothetical protein